MNAEEKRETCMVQLVKSQSDLYAFVRSLMPFNAADVDDVVQETDIALVKRAEEYDPSRPFRTWLFTFARLQVLKFFTLRKREPLVFDDALAEQFAGVWEDVLPGDSDTNSTANLIKNLARCKERLSARQRELIDAYYLRREPLVAIAKRQRANPHTLSTLLGYIRKKLGDCIRRQCRLDEEDGVSEPTPEEALLNDVLSNPAGTRHEADRLHACLQSPRLLRYWCGQCLVHGLLAYETSATAAASVPVPGAHVRRQPRHRLAAAAVILLLAGLAIAAVVRFAAVRESESTSSGTLSPSTIAETPAAAASLPVAVTPTAVVTSNSLGISVLLPATVLRVAPPLEAAAEAAAVTKGENMNMKSIAAAAAVAVAAVAPPAVTQATEDPSVVVTCLTDQGWIETRWIVVALTEGRDTWTLSTVPPAGTIYRFF